MHNIVYPCVIRITSEMSVNSLAISAIGNKIMQNYRLISPNKLKHFLSLWKTAQILHMLSKISHVFRNQRIQHCITTSSNTTVFPATPQGTTDCCITYSIHQCIARRSNRNSNSSNQIQEFRKTGRRCEIQKYSTNSSNTTQNSAKHDKWFSTTTQIPAIQILLAI